MLVVFKIADIFIVFSEVIILITFVAKKNEIELLLAEINCELRLSKDDKYNYDIYNNILCRKIGNYSLLSGAGDLSYPQKP